MKNKTETKRRNTLLGLVAYTAFVTAAVGYGVHENIRYRNLAQEYSVTGNIEKANENSFKSLMTIPITAQASLSYIPLVYYLKKLKGGNKQNANTK